MKKVCVSHIMYFSEKLGQNPFSGAENHIMTLLPALTKCESSVDVELIALIWVDGEYVQKRLREVSALGVKVTQLRRTPAGLLRSRLSRAIGCMIRLTVLLRTRRDRIIHVHLDLFAVVLATFLSGCSKVVVSIHNDEEFYRKFRWRKWLAFIDLYVRRYIAITEHVKSYYSDVVGIKRSKIARIYYGVELHEKGECVAKLLQNESKGFVVGFIGRLTVQKNLFVLLKAAEIVPDVLFMLIGDGSERPRLEALSREMNLRNVRFFGNIPNASSYMRSFDVFCLPSRWEGLGLVLVEAMLQKVPIVASRGGAIPEILCDGKYGTHFNTFEPADLAEKIVGIRQDMSRAQKRAEDAFHYAVERFSVERMAAETLAVYQSV